ncbi:MAG: hypothetical protein GKC10_03465 [Methanosarcinales archaeon]|nr:hypothetical protein [Methanosarcinales archaeon]
MYEDLGTLIGKGFRIWRNNLSLAMPFLLAGLALLLALAPTLLAVIYLVGTVNLEQLSETELQAALLENIVPLALVGVLSLLAAGLVSSFFTAGAVGMASQANQESTTSLSTMWSSGRRYCLRMFAASVIIGLMVIAGLLLLLAATAVLMGTSLQIDPGLLANPQEIFQQPQMAAFVLALVSLMILFSLILSLVTALVYYALVIDDLGATRAIGVSIRFFWDNKFDVFIIWLIIIALSMALSIPGQLSPTSSFASAWSAINGIISVAVLSPLSAVWWARLYLSRTGKNLFKEDDWEYLR